MSIFKGSLSASIQENHQFFSKHGLLESLGLSSFTKTSCIIIYKKNRNLLQGVDNFDTLPMTLSENTTILNLFTNLKCEYTRFNKAAEQYESAKTSISLSNLYSLIDYHENLQFNSNFAVNEENNLKIIDINTSLEQCVVCTGRILGSLVTVELRFQDRANRSNQRKIAFSNINIAAPPSMPMGNTYSQSTSNSHQSGSILNVGSYIPNSKSNFSQDSVAAPLQMFYDSNTNKWKSGNVQILARLLTDIDPAPVESLDGADFNNIEDILTRTRGFTTGTALPLSIEQGNPYLFGPTFEECLVKNKVEINVVNRALRSFKKDTIVILTEINGEWIIQDFGESLEAFKSPVAFGDWSFFKYIANSDSYFKDARYYDTGENIYTLDIKPQIYEEESRKRFYNNILTTWSNSESFIQDGIERPSLLSIYQNSLQTIVNLNTNNRQSAFQPSVKFYIASIFDQLFDGVGGYSDLTVLEYVNILDQEAFVGTFPGAFQQPTFFKTFWGPAYQDGFKTFAYNPNGKDNNNDLGFFGSVSDPNNQFFLAPFPPIQLASDQINQRLFNMPAEVGGIFINPFSIFQNWNNLGTANFIINNQYIHSPYYGTSEPVSKNKLQFSPLYAEMVAERNIYIGLRTSRIRADLGVSNLLGNLFDRSATFGFSDVYDVPPGPFVRIADTGALRRSELKQAAFSAGGMPVRAFDPYDFGIGLPSSGPFCVGVISAKQTISKRGGGDINFSTNQVFGRNNFNRIGGGQQTGVTILGLGLGTTAVGFASDLAPGRSSPTWGSRTDSISSFGTTALHVRIFDHWPEDQTMFDPRYFGVLHFNAGSYYNPNGILFTKTGESEENLNKRINEAKKLDIPIPTMENGTLLTSGSINKDTKLMPKNLWKLNPIRRGVLLSGDGFIYLYHVIGLSGGSVHFGGTGFNSNFEYSLQSKNVKFNFVVSGGRITSFTFAKDDLDNILIGDNFLPEDFNSSTPIIENDNVVGSNAQDKACILNIPSPTQGGKSAILKFTSGIVWLKKAKDEPPKGGNITRLTKSSRGGESGMISGGQETSVSLEKNNSGKYDCFYHFHNDILHTLAYEYGAMPAWLQYVNLTIN
jgi:hypothetical protein